MSSGMQRSLGGRNTALTPISVTHMIPYFVIILSIICHISLERSSISTVTYGYKCEPRLHITAMDNSQTIWSARLTKEHCYSRGRRIL